MLKDDNGWFDAVNGHLETVKRVRRVENANFRSAHRGSEKDALTNRFICFMSSLKLLLRNRIFCCFQFWSFYYCKTRTTLIISNSLICRYKKFLVRWKLSKRKNPLIAFGMPVAVHFQITENHCSQFHEKKRKNKIESFRLYGVEMLLNIHQSSKIKFV